MSRRTAQPLPTLLLFAEPLQREGLLRWLEQDPPLAQVVSEVERLEGPPAMVIWSLSPPPEENRLAQEVRRLVDRWQPAPVLLLLSGRHPYRRELLLRLPVRGLLEQPDAEALRRAIPTLLAGGRVLEIAGSGGEAAAPPPPEPLGLGQWLLISGLQQIDAELDLCRRLLDPPPAQLLPLLLLQGRQRELRAARGLLLWIWGPVSLAWSQPPMPAPAAGAAAAGHERTRDADPSPCLAITLRQSSSDGIWEALRQRLVEASEVAPLNHTGQLLALDGLHPDRRRDLLLALLEQFDQLRRRLQQEELQGEGLVARWVDRQAELRQQALRHLAGSYVQLPCEGQLRPVAEALLPAAAGEAEDPELPDPLAMLGTLVEARPLLVEGQLLAPDEPRAVLYLELLLSNWLVRTAELLSAEVLAACAEWPELRRYLLRPDYLSTRNLERLRNQLNARQRWISWVDRPIQLYESRRALYRLEAGAIRTVDLTEPRDAELRQLGWIQQLVTLALEARDALAPQIQSLVRGLGDLLVVLLTRVVGRAIGLVGRGIAQGMGRGLGRG